MSVLALWADLPWLEDLVDEDDQPAVHPELLTFAAGFGWWSASAELPDID